jgi:hypothetical protein
LKVLPGTARNAASANANTWVFHPGSRLRFDNDTPFGVATTEGRWADTTAIALNTTVLEIYGDGAASAYNTETVGDVSIAGGSEILLRRRGAFDAVLNTGNITRSGSGTLMVTGMDTNTNTVTGLGVAGAVSAMRLTATNGLSLMNNNMVDPWITDRVGNQFLKYDGTLGFQPITTGSSPANYVSIVNTVATTLTSGGNIPLNNGTEILSAAGSNNYTLASNLDLYALRLERDIDKSADGAANRIIVRSGGIIQVANTPTINADLLFGSAGDGTGEALIWASNNTLQINGKIFASQVTKSGTAFLNVRSDQPQFTGNWVVNGGGVQFLSPNAASTGQVILNGSRMNDRDSTYNLTEVRYNFNSGSPELFHLGRWQDHWLRHQPYLRGNSVGSPPATSGGGSPSPPTPLLARVWKEPCSFRWTAPAARSAPAL